jgi:hypothetical protein
MKFFLYINIILIKYIVCRHMPHKLNTDHLKVIQKLMDYTFYIGNILRLYCYILLCISLNPTHNLHVVYVQLRSRV